MIFVNDYHPPHVHVFGAGGVARITLEGPDGPALDWSVGIGRLEVRRIIQEARRERLRLLTKWKLIHG